MQTSIGFKLQSHFCLRSIGLPLYIVDMTMHFSQNIFSLDQFVFKRHAHAFRLQIGLDTNLGFRPILIRETPIKKSTKRLKHDFQNVRIIRIEIMHFYSSD